MWSARSPWRSWTMLPAVVLSLLVLVAAPGPAAACSALCSTQGNLPIPWYDDSGAYFDGASTWQLDSSSTIVRRGRGFRQEHEPVEDGLRGLFFLSPSMGWIVGEGGSILHIGDGGRHWKTQTVPGDLALTKVHCADAHHCWALSDAGVIVATSDGGHWTSLGRLPAAESEDDTSGVQDLFFVSPTTGWVTTANGALHATHDGGATWSTSQVRLAEGEDAGPLGIVRFADERIGWIAGGSRLARTQDGGATWDVTLDVGKNLWIAALAWRSASEVYVAVGGECGAYKRDGTSYWSTDGGQTWTDLVDPWEKEVDWEALVQARVPAAPMERLTLVQSWSSEQLDLTDVVAEGRNVRERHLRIARRAPCGDTEVLAHERRRTQSLAAWAEGFDPCRLEPQATSEALNRFAGNGPRRRLTVSCGGSPKTFEVPTVFRRQVARNSPSLVQLVDLVDRLSTGAEWSQDDDERLRRAGAAEVPQILAGTYDRLLPDPRVVHALLTQYPGPQPLGMMGRVTWQGPAGLHPEEMALPEYPPIARLARVQGAVTLDLSIDAASGRVQQARLARGIPLLDQAALVAARGWRFAPDTADVSPRLTLQYTLEACVPGGALE